MTKLFLIALGGGIGALLRYGLQGLTYRIVSGIFPWGTVLVNLIGCLVIGLLWGLFERFEVVPLLRTFLLVGLLGGFTTFSSFGLESFNLIRDNEIRLAVAYILLSNFGGIALVFVGFALSRYTVDLVK
jgi:fluoride exporter